MTVKEQSPVFTKVSVDLNTLSRLRTLAGAKPVARYLRDLTNELAQNTPPSLDDLAGGFSLTPIKRQLDLILANQERLFKMMEEDYDFAHILDTATSSTFAAMSPQLHMEYERTFKRLQADNEDQRKRGAKYEAATKDSPEFQAWEDAIKSGIPTCPESPAFETDEKGNVIYENGKPKIVADPIFGRARKKKHA